MRHLSAAATALLFLLPASAGAFRQPQTVEQALAGRTPGKPVSCIQLPRVGSTQIFDSGAILYRMNGGPDYLNKPDGCDILRSDRATATRTPSTSICRGDLLRVFDPVAHFDYGACPLGDFVPYPRVKKGQ